MNGYAVHVELVRVVDGDTIEVRAVGENDVVLAYQTTLENCPTGEPTPLRLVKPGATAHIRFADYNAPEKREPGGAEATHKLQAAFEKNTEPLWLFVEQPKDKHGDGRIDIPDMLRQWVSFGRIIGRIITGGEDICRFGEKGSSQ